MKPVAAFQAAGTAVAFDGEPSAAELDAIEQEMPLIQAEMDLLGVEIWMLDRPATELGDKRLRQSINRVLAECRNLTNRVGLELTGGAA